MEITNKKKRWINIASLIGVYVAAIGLMGLYGFKSIDNYNTIDKGEPINEEIVTQQNVLSSLTEKIMAYSNLYIEWDTARDKARHEQKLEDIEKGIKLIREKLDESNYSDSLFFKNEKLIAEVGIIIRRMKDDREKIKKMEDRHEDKIKVIEIEHVRALQIVEGKAQSDKIDASAAQSDAQAVIRDKPKEFHHHFKITICEDDIVKGEENCKPFLVINTHDFKADNLAYKDFDRIDDKGNKGDKASAIIIEPIKVEIK